MGNSIQEYCKKINRHLTFIDICSLFLTLTGLLILVVTLTGKQQDSIQKVIYSEGKVKQDRGEVRAGQPFASKNGKTYTFTWCKGSSVIAAKNKLYFPSEEAAKNSGRTLSKLCK